MIGSPRKQFRRTVTLAMAWLVAGACVLVSTTPAFAQGGTTPAWLNPKGPDSAAIASLFNIVLAIAVVVFVVVEGLILLSAWRFRRRPTDTTEPAQIHGNQRLEIAWTILPALIVVTLFVLALQTQQTLDSQPATATDPMTVRVIGHQYWWEYQYPDLGITTATDLVIPAGTVVNLEITSVDVIHSFWVPQLNGKTDAFPNHINTTSIEADQPGTFYGQCAELCGASHANMRVTVIAKDATDWASWVAAQKSGPLQPTEALAQRGQLIFLTGACIGCHTISGTPAQGKTGPNLTHVASRTSIAGGMLTNTEGNLKRWLANPPGIKPGSIMPNLNLSQSDIDALTAYLQSLK